MAHSTRFLASIILWLGAAVQSLGAQPSGFELPLARFSDTTAPCLTAHNQGRDLIVEYVDSQGGIVFRSGSWLGTDGRYLLPAPGEEIATLRFRTLEEASVSPDDVAIDDCPDDLPLNGIDALASAVDARLSGYLGEPIDRDLIDDRFLQAITEFEQSGHTHWLAVAHQEYAAFKRSIDQLSVAEDHHKAARDLFQSIDDPAGEAAAINSLGLATLRDGRLAEAVSHFDEALSLFLALEDFHHVAAVNNNLGLLSMRIGDLDQAASRLDLALTLLQGPIDLRSASPDLDMAVPRDGAANLTWALNTLNNLAIVRMRQGASDLAERYWRNYLAASQRIDRALGAAQARHSLGTLMLRQGRLDEALNLLGEALQHFVRLDARRWSTEARVQLSILYYRLGDTDLALEYAEQAIDPSLEDRVARVKAYANLAWMQQEIGSLDAALVTYDLALDDLQDTDDRMLHRRIRSERAHVEVYLGRVAEAIDTQQVVLEQIEGEDEAAFAARVRYRLALAHMHGNDPDRAEPLLESALADFQQADDIYYELLALEALAQINATSPAVQLDYSQRAVERAFELRSLPLADLRQVGVAATLGRIENEHVRLLIRSGRVDEAWALAERIRSAALLDGRQARTRVKTSKLRQSLMDEHAHLIEQLHQLRLSQDDSSIERNAADLRLRLDRIETRLRQLPSGPPRHPGIDRASLQESLRPGQLLLSYFEQPDHLLLWATSPETSRFFVIDSTDKIRDQIAQLQSRLAHPRHAVGAIDRLGRELGDRLLRPATSLLDSADELLVQPHGALHALPFAVMIHDDQVLIDRWSLRRVVSAQSAVAEPNRDARTKPERLLVVADPGWNQRSGDSALLPDQSLVGRLMRDGLLTRLPGTAREAEALGALDGPAMAVSLRTGRQASRQFLANGGLSGHSLLHFATHGLVDLRYPALSALLLADEEGTGPALLRPYDIAKLHINARLVVLSGCDTGAGPIQAGEGALSLARPFLIAGAQEVMSTLWKIDDARTAEFMQSFYRHLLIDGGSPATALAAAQREMRQDRSTAHPYYWAGFILASTSLDSGPIAIR